MRKSIKGFFSGRREYFITDNVENYQHIVIINVTLTFIIVFIIVFNSVMTTCS